MSQLDLTNKTVFGVALNFKSLMESHQAAFNEKPYVAPPKKPVLFIKTPNTYNLTHVVPAGNLEKVQTGANIAIVMGKDATRVTKENALEYVKGITVANDYSLPIESYYRPAVVAKCRDGFFTINETITPLSEIADLNNLTLTLSVNGDEKQRETSENWVRDLPELLETITEFMTLHEGDVLLTGTPANNIYVSAGDKVTASIEGISTLTDTISGEDA
ncbi:fumarylacetoacetate hydrolase family protein [Ignatzschineria sp. RMDPL8A]|uniref:fumarylacetoacetate hydrolase family protein n=1 Tax=Ignatzschineria sp. RMDPL8A TaxID=2999236 RepID=UPI0024467CF1|nr:fumarylacetoacetate hydrolase family protein [Ignatzschineria sp. RMDPL8A]MDG9730306.1 fumarylacetoacetate hydrolase family protein [Ignatzschineria sp. RMDPL8A]